VEATELSQARLTVALGAIGIGVILLAMAYLVGVKQKTGLISGYTPGTASDEAGLTRVIATRVCALAIAYLVLGVAFQFVAGTIAIVIWVVVVLVATYAGVIAILMGQARFTGASARPGKAPPDRAQSTEETDS